MALSSGGVTFARTAATSVSSTARTVAALSPRSRVATSWASARKPTVSWYSCWEISRPCASMPFEYSSTATPTMLDSRRAGLSCARRLPAPATRSAAASVLLRTILQFIPTECIGIAGGPLPARNAVQPLQDYHRTRRRLAVRKRQPRVSDVQLAGPDFCFPMQRERGTPQCIEHDFHLAPAQPACRVRTGECLVGRLLGGNARGEMHVGMHALQCIRGFRRGEQPFDSLGPLRCEQFLDPRDVHEIHAHADDHRLRPRPDPR